MSYLYDHNSAVPAAAWLGSASRHERKNSPGSVQRGKKQLLNPPIQKLYLKRPLNALNVKCSEKLPLLTFLRAVLWLLNSPTLHHLSGVTATQFSLIESDPFAELQRSADQKLVKPQTSVFSCKPLRPSEVQGQSPVVNLFW